MGRRHIRGEKQKKRDEFGRELLKRSLIGLIIHHFPSFKVSKKSNWSCERPTGKIMQRVGIALHPLDILSLSLSLSSPRSLSLFYLFPFEFSLQIQLDFEKGNWPEWTFPEGTRLNSPGICVRWTE